MPEIITQPRDFTQKDVQAQNIGLHPTILTGFFRNFAIWKFSSAEHSYDPELRKDYPIWAETDQENRENLSKIKIVTAGEFNPKDAGQRPAVIIQRDEFGLLDPLGIKDSYTGPGHFIGAPNPLNEAQFGQRQQKTLIAGAHRFVCIHTSPESAERIATDLWLSACDFMHVLRENLQELGQCSVGNLRPMKVSKVSPFKESTEHWACEFMIAYQYSRDVQINQRVPILKRFLMSTNFQTAGAAG